MTVSWGSYRLPSCFNTTTQRQLLLARYLAHACMASDAVSEGYGIHGIGRQARLINSSLMLPWNAQHEHDCFPTSRCTDAAYVIIFNVT